MTQKQKMALVRAGKSWKTGAKKTPHRRVSGIGASVGATRHVKRASSGKRVVIVNGTKPRRKYKPRSIMGAFAAGNKLKEVAVMAAGIGAGAAFTHMIARPLEHKLVAKYPHFTKWMGAAEIAAGGLVFINIKNPFIKMMGLGMMAGGVHTVMKQTNLGLHNPAESTMGYLGETVRQEIPYSVGNIIDDKRPYVNTSTVYGIGNIVNRNSNRPVHTSVVGDWSDDINDNDILMPKGAFGY